MAQPKVTTGKGGGGTPVDPMKHRPVHLAEENYDIPVDDYAQYPKIKVLQALSPEVEPGNEKLIPNARPGMIIIGTSVPQLLDGDKGVFVYPLVVKKRYAEYIPRAKGGGFVASYDTREDMEAGFTPGNDITAVVEFLCALADGNETTDTPTLVLFSMDTPTKLGVAKKWAGMISEYKTMNGVKYHLKAIGTKNKKQQFYYNWSVVPCGWTDKKVHAALEMLSEQEGQRFLPAPQDSDI